MLIRTLEQVPNLCFSELRTPHQWRGEGRAWPGTCPAKVRPAHVCTALVLLAQCLSIQQVPGQYQCPDYGHGWFSMSLLPRLHHHDIMTIVELFFILTIVELLHRATTKFSCYTFNTEKKRKKEKILFPGPSPNPSPNLNPNCNTTP